jgi:hypothetical protein
MNVSVCVTLNETAVFNNVLVAARVSANPLIEMSSSSSKSSLPMSFVDKKSSPEKRTELIERAVTEHNLRALRVLAITGGLESNALRRRAWPMLVGLHDDELKKNYTVNLFHHREYEQVEVDVARSLWRFTVGQDARRDALREQLKRVLNSILCNHPHLNYFQVSVL